jgi:phytoene desaturase (3,4-didehydrolycopene-forming)
MNGHTSVQKRVVIVGAGVGGISLAARLSQIDGISVSVYEKNDYHGGRCSLIHGDGGYRFDRGPSLLLLPKLFEEAFADLGTSLKAEGVELLKCDPPALTSVGRSRSLRRRREHASEHRSCRYEARD